MKLLIGLILAVFVGIGCRWFGIPLPGPPAIMGAAMAVGMASGYTATDYFLSRQPTSPQAEVRSTRSVVGAVAEAVPVETQQTNSPGKDLN
jgi:XapX domain-containing protein